MMSDHDRLVRAAAHQYAAMGWQVIPLDANNAPMIPVELATSDHNDIDLIYEWGAAMQGAGREVVE